MVEEIFEGDDAPFLQRLRDARANAFDELQGRFKGQEHNSDAISARLASGGP